MHSKGPWTTLIQAVWWMLTGLTIALFLVAMPVYYQQLQQICLKSPCLALQLSIGRAILLELSGLNFSLYAQLIVAIQVLVYLTNLAIGVFIFSRKSKDWLAILVSLMLITSLQADLYRGLQLAYPETRWAVIFLGVINSILLVVFFYIFPTGSFKPRWTVGLAVFWILTLFANSFFPGLAITSQSRPGFLFVLFLVGLVGSSLIVLVYRYRSIFNPVQRLQSKWVVFGVVITWGGEVVLEILRLALPIFEQNAIWLISWNILAIAWSVLLPISILIAVLSSALLDIDVLIQRTLSYTLLTITLLVVYIGSVLFLQRIFESITGQSSSIVSIISTLVIAALFTPLRQKIQSNIDRIFFRKHYDTEQAVEVFSASVREDVDLEEISAQFAGIIHAALQPEFLSLWLCRSSGSGEISNENRIR